MQAAQATAVPPTIDLAPTTSATPPVLRPSGTVLNPQALIDMVMAAGNPNLDQLERLLTLQQRFEEGQREHQRYLDERAERMRKQTAEEAFWDDFAKFTGENITIPKTKQVKQKSKDPGKAAPSYWQSEFHVVGNMIRPALARHGFGYDFDTKHGVKDFGETKAPWCWVTVTLRHRLGHFRQVALEGPPDDSGHKNHLQEMRSSATFLKRHALLDVTGVPEEGRDNNGRGARGDAEDEENEQQSAADAPALQEGWAASRTGLPGLNAWWQALSDAQRTRFTSEFTKMKADARRVGQAVSQ